MKAILNVVPAAVLALGLGGSGQAQETKAAEPAKKPVTAKAPVKKEPVLMAAGDLKWVDVPEMKGAQQAVVTGDPTKGAYDAFNKWPGGLEHPQHTHTLTVEAVVVSGVMTVSIDGGPVKEYPAGSYAKIPGGVKHTSGCKAGADCVFFSSQTGKFDMKPVAAPAAK